MAMDKGVNPVEVDGHPNGVDGNVVGPDYFETLGTVLRTLVPLGITGIAAGAFPALRASRIEPVRALHCE